MSRVRVQVVTFLYVELFKYYENRKFIRQQGKFILEARQYEKFNQIPDHFSRQGFEVCICWYMVFCLFHCYVISPSRILRQYRKAGTESYNLYFLTFITKIPLSNMTPEF